MKTMTSEIDDESTLPIIDFGALQGEHFFPSFLFYHGLLEVHEY
jgi:hypothetical protein